MRTVFSRKERKERKEFRAYLKTLPLCDSYENICQYAKSLWRFPYQSRLLDVSLSPIRNVGRLSVKA
jgi:hypothetical protein